MIPDLSCFVTMNITCCYCVLFFSVVFNDELKLITNLSSQQRLSQETVIGSGIKVHRSWNNYSDYDETFC